MGAERYASVFDGIRMDFSLTVSAVFHLPGTVFTSNWLQVFGVGESVVQYEGKAGENAMRLKRKDAVPGVTIEVFRGGLKCEVQH
jgi:hypothetical protein